jgi:predicted nucleotidyltransferase
VHASKWTCPCSNPAIRAEVAAPTGTIGAVLPPPVPPTLPEGYAGAWRRIVADLTADPAVLGATISGSVLRGEGGPTSDLDVYVLIRGAERRRRTYVCEDVLVEEFRNPETWIRHYFQERDDAPALHMLGYGTVVLDRDPAFAPICAEARRLFTEGPLALTPEKDVVEQYVVWDAWCDVKDLLAAGADVQAVGLMHWQMVRTITAHHRRQRRWLPTLKRLLESLRAWDVPLATELGAFWGLGGRDARAAFARFDAIVRHVLAPHDPDRPVLWQSAPERLEDDA